MAKAKRKSSIRRETATGAKRKNSRRRRWSARVTQRSDALDLERGVFTRRSARAVAESLKKSAERSGRRKSSPLRSAMSMLNFEINRAGRNLSPSRRRVLNDAKDELRKLYGLQARKRSGQKA
jgi:hypothetical protein